MPSMIGPNSPLSTSLLSCSPSTFRAFRAPFSSTSPFIRRMVAPIAFHFCRNSPASMCRLMALTSDTLNDEEDEEITRLFNAKKSPEEVSMCHSPFSSLVDVITKGEADVYRSVEGGATMIQLRDKTNGIGIPPPPLPLRSSSSYGPSCQEIVAPSP